ncbi:hypothetical protein BDA99DRAFT_517656 [Phascolomyces articulosus]|uniref:Uncharacterized protein n=1 Tax=Phascolomyces articulosus TaxID=60185 RepID=A0AAD5PDA0_9FUNG|nr:hypothetical protein BDA99DRAFT_517656 [Phascolomyces articulosus]
MDNDESLWVPSCQQNQKVYEREIPRWQHIRTQAEQQDSENSLRALESKLARLKSKPIKATTNQPTDIIPYQEEGTWYSESESESEIEDKPTKGREEDHEGLYLLWRERAQQQGHSEYHDELDKAIEQQKREQEYTWHWAFSWIPKCCSCCFITTTTS